jgi:hypothetical protein
MSITVIYKAVQTLYLKIVYQFSVMLPVDTFEIRKHFISLFLPLSL